MFVGEAKRRSIGGSETSYGWAYCFKLWIEDRKRTIIRWVNENAKWTKFTNLKSKNCSWEIMPRTTAKK